MTYQNVEIKFDLPADVPPEVRAIAEESCAAGQLSMDTFTTVAAKFPAAVPSVRDMACQMFLHGMATSLLRHLDHRAASELIIGLADAYRDLQRLAAQAEPGGGSVEDDAGTIKVSKVPLDEHEVQP